MESEYIRKVLDGDAQAFRYFIEKYRNMAYSLAMSMVKNVPIAEEVTQDAFLKAYNSLGKFERKSKFSTWLYKIITNEALKRLRKKDFKYVEDIPDYIADINNSILALTEQEQKHYINLGLKRLLLRLFYLDKRSIKEIIDITGLSKANIKTILQRARKRLFLVLKEELKNEVKSIL